MRRAGELGYLGLCFPEEYGGQGGDYFYSLVRAECMSYSGSGGTNMGFAVQTDMVLPPVHLLGTEEQKQRYLVPGIKGERIGCLGITEPGAGSDVAGIRTTAIRDGDEYVINGAKTFITNGARADFCVLVTKTDPDARHDGITLFLVDLRDEDGNTSRGSRSRASWRRWACTPPTPASSRSRTCAFRRTPCWARSARASTTSPGSSRASAWSPPPAATRPAERMFERTLEYAKERQAFGRPIGKFQVDPPQVRRDGDEDRGGEADGLRDRLALRQRRVPGARDHDGEAVRHPGLPTRSPTSACRSTAATAT